jgi:hypothetical protein
MDTKTDGNFWRWVEVVGVIGVFGSLLFVGYEVRQSTQATRAATYHAIVEGNIEIQRALLDHPDLVDLNLRARAGSGSVTEAEWGRLMEMWLLTVRVWEDSYRQMLLKTVDEEVLQQWLSLDLPRTEGFTEFWVRRRIQVDPSFREYLEGRFPNLSVDPGGPAP